MPVLTSDYWVGRAQKSAGFIQQTFNDPKTIERLLKLADSISYPYVIDECPDGMPLIMTAGNGGSHSLAEHLTGELIWRLDKNNEIRIPSVCLSSNATVLTALANDENYEEALTWYAGTLFWLQGSGRRQILIAFSPSTESKNILDLLDTVGYDSIVHRVLFAGEDKNEELPADDIFYVRGPGAPTTSIIQEVHQVYVHMLCEMISEGLKRCIKQES